MEELGLLRACHSGCRSSQRWVKALDRRVSIVTAHSAEEKKAPGVGPAQMREMSSILPATGSRMTGVGCEASRVSGKRCSLQAPTVHVMVSVGGFRLSERRCRRLRRSSDGTEMQIVANGRRTRGRLSKRSGYSDRLGAVQRIEMGVGGVGDGEGEVMLVVRTQRARAELRDAQCGLGATVGVTGAGALLQSETKHQTD